MNYLDVIESSTIREQSSLCPWDGRLPHHYVDMLEVDPTEVYAKRRFYEIVDGYVKEEDFQFPENSTSLHLSKDINGNHISAFFLNGVYCYRFFNDLIQKAEIVEVPDATSMVVTISTPYQTETTPEGLVMFTRIKGNETELVVRNQLTRYAESAEKVIFKVEGDKQLRTAGMARNNRFLYRFFNKIKMVG